MGSSASKFENGNIVLQTDKPYFNPGEDVHGNIYLFLNQSYPGTLLELELKGKEKVEWTVRKNTAGENYSYRVRDKESIIDYKSPVYSFYGESTPAGQYTFPFRIKLPHNIPASCNFNGNDSAKSIGKVKYSLKARLLPRDPDKMKEMTYKQTIVVREIPHDVPVNSSANYSDNVNSCCCCCSSGIVHLETQCDKSAYCPNETVKIMSRIDNSDCNKDIKTIKVQLKQNVSLFAKKRAFEIFSTDHTVNFDNTVLNQDYPGISKNKKSDGFQFMELPLRKQYHDPGKSTYSEFQQDKDDQYLADGIQPTVSGKLVKINYKLRIYPEYKTCCVCSPPQTDIPLFISPPALPSFQQLQAPPGWNPQVFNEIDMAGPVKLTNEHSKLTDSAKQ